MAPLELHPATEADARRAVQIEHVAYSSNPFTKILFPGPMPDNVQELRAEGLIKQLKADDTTRWLKVVDPDLEGDEQTVAFAKWQIYQESPKLTPREFGDGCNIEACQAVFGGIQEQRMRILGDQPYVYLHLLQTDPKHKGRGAGSMLVQWGLDEAQKLGYIAYLESSEEAHSLYKSKGFKDIEVHRVDMSKWGAEKPHDTWAMKWEPLTT